MLTARSTGLLAESYLGAAGGALAHLQEHGFILGVCILIVGPKNRLCFFFYILLPGVLANPYMLSPAWCSRVGRFWPSRFWLTSRLEPGCTEASAHDLSDKSGWNFHDFHTSWSHRSYQLDAQGRSCQLTRFVDDLLVFFASYISVVF